MKRILVVDDIAENLCVLEAILSANGYEVVSANNGAEALASARNQPPDLVIADVLMPVMDGFSLCRQWHLEEPLAKIPFIFFTATYTDARDEQLAMDLGACRFVIKPQEPQVLIEIVRTVLAGRATRMAPAVTPSSRSDEIVTLGEYNEALVRKLEKKVADLEETRAALEEDLRQRNQAEESLRESESRLRAIFDTEPECVKLLAADGSLLDMNPAGLRMVEADSFQQVAHQCIYPLIVEKHRDAFRKLNAKIFRGESGTLEFQLVGLKGNRRWLETHASPLRSATGAVTALLGITRDITERKLADEALRASQESLNEIVNSVDGIVWEANPQTFQFSFVSASAERILGYPAERWITEPTFWKDHLHPEDRDSAVEFCVASTRRGKSHQFEYRMLSADGREVWLKDIVTVVTRDGVPVKLLGILVDITERKRIQDALCASEERYRLLFERNLAGVFQSTMEGRILDCNEAFVRMFGYDSKEELLRCPAANLYPQQQNRTDFIKSLLAKGKLTGIELQLKRKDGNLIWGFENVTLVPMPDGKEIIQGTLVEVTELKRTEQALRLSEASLDAAQDRAKFGSWELDLQTQSGRWSQNMFRLFECDSTAGTPTFAEFIEMIHPVDREQMLKSRKQLLETGQDANGDFRFISKNGAVRYYSYNIQCLRDLLGQTIRLAGTMQDITERRRLEEQLRQSQKIEALGQLTGGVAHDFNNLLTIINGNTEIVLNSLPPNDPKKGLLAEVAKAGTRAASLTGQLLAFGRKQLLAPRPLCLNGIIAGIETMLRRTIGENIQLAISLDATLDQVCLDPNQLEQVIVNLVVNAQDAMPNGGTLTIATANLILHEDTCQQYPGCQPGRYVRLNVTDTGCGMTPETQSHIFEPFFTTKEVGKGTGLGLATVYGIVTQSGGQIDVETQLDIGTTFKILFPSSNAVLTPPTASPETNELRRGHETVLLVEDEDGVRKLARLILDMQGYHVLEATDGLNAIEIEMAHEGIISLLITDIVMPKMSGRKLVETIRLRRPNIKTLYISGYIDDAAIRHGIKDSSRSFLQKPFSLQALAIRVREILDDYSIP